MKITWSNTPLPFCWKWVPRAGSGNSAKQEVSGIIGVIWVSINRF
jgi:hypothetical protein